MPKKRGLSRRIDEPSTSQMAIEDAETSIEIDDEDPASQTQLQTQTKRSRRQTQQEPITYLEREVVEKVVERINRNYFSLKAFKISQIFKPDDKIKTRRQFFLIPHIVEKIKEINGIELINNDRVFFLSFPKDLRESLKTSDPEKFKMITEISDEIQRFNLLALYTALAIIYFHHGKIEEGLLKRRLLSSVDDPHHYLDGVKYDTLITSFYDCLWIEKRKYTENIREEAKFYVHWGLRAKVEINKKDLFPLYCEIGGVEDVSELPHWLVDAINNDVEYP